jgi:hypothetical protein
MYATKEKKKYLLTVRRRNIGDGSHRATKKLALFPGVSTYMDDTK